MFLVLYIDNFERLYIFFVLKRILRKVICIFYFDLWFFLYIKVVFEETEDGEEVKIVVVWEFDYVSGMIVVVYVVRLEEKLVDGLVIMLRFVFGKVNCNCIKFLYLGILLFFYEMKLK